jgi:hypothetical protein
MKLFGIEILKAKEFNDINIKLNKVTKAFEDMGGTLRVRPNLDSVSYSATAQGLPLPYGISLEKCYELSYYSDTLTIVQRALNGEIFRNGLEAKPLFDAKCTACANTTDHMDEDMKCDVCGADMQEPDPFQKIIVEEIIKGKINANDQNLLDVEKETETDCEIVDDIYILHSKIYTYDANGDIIDQKIIEILEVKPTVIKLIVDKTGRYGYLQDGKLALVCPEHKNTLQQGPKCKTCKRTLYPAHYISGSNDNYIYYLKDEIYHSNRYRKSKTYGFPPVFTVWYKIKSLIAQDKTTMDTYVGQRPPKGLLVWPTANKATLKESYKEAVDFVKNNPGAIPIMTQELNQMNGKNTPVQFLDFMKSPVEMQLIDQREESRRTIGAVYGVSPVFQNDVSTSGGLNNEGLQITVTVRAAQEGQNFWNDYHNWLVKQYGVTDWTISLEPTEEQDEAADVDLDIKKATHANMMRSMGFKVERDATGEFVFSGEASPPMPFSFGTAMPQDNQNTSNESDNRQDGSPDAIKSINKTGTLINNQIETNFERLLKKKLNEAKNKIADILGTFLAKKQIFELKKGEQDTLKSQIENILNPNDIKNSVYASVSVEFHGAIDKFEKKFGVNIIPNERALQYIQEYTFENIKGMTEELSNKLRGEISRGIMSGQNRTDIAKSISEVLNVAKSRATAIAQTETVRAYNTGAISAAKESRLKLVKKVINPDPISDICQTLSEQAPIPLDQSFEYDGETWETAPFHVNCKSDVVFELDEG